VGWSPVKKVPIIVHLKDLQEAASAYKPNAVFADYERCDLLTLCLAVLTESIKES
jgi:hypothetical protein